MASKSKKKPGKKKPSRHENPKPARHENPKPLLARKLLFWERLLIAVILALAVVGAYTVLWNLSKSYERAQLQEGEGGEMMTIDSPGVELVEGSGRKWPPGSLDECSAFPMEANPGSANYLDRYSTMDCVVRYLVDTNSEAYCREIGDVFISQECSMRVAIESGNKEWCDYVVMPSKKQKCLEAFGEEYEDNWAGPAPSEEPEN